MEEEIINLEELKATLGTSFKDTLVYDPILGSHFIVKYKDGGWGVMKTRRDKNGSLKWTVVCYPTTLKGCLSVVSQAHINEEGKVYETLRSYIDTCKEELEKINNAYSNIEI